MQTSLTKKHTENSLKSLSRANLNFLRQYPGENSARQPVHTVYGGAHLFKSDTPTKLGGFALKFMDEYAPDFSTFARAVGLNGAEKLPLATESIKNLEEALKKNPLEARKTKPEAWLAYTVYQRVREKLTKEPVEDFRIDFEDGFGNRSVEEEYETAERTAKELAKGMADGTLSPFIGIRIKTFTDELVQRSIETTDIFISTLVRETKGKIPQNFVVTLPKVTIPEQVSTLVEVFEQLEFANSLPAGILKMEIMVETTQSIINPKGQCTLPELVSASRGRCVAAHFGTYDYTASCNIVAAHQSMDHPACDFARHMMKVSLAGTGVWLSDGATNIMPVPSHRAEPGKTLSSEQIQENQRMVSSAWKLAYGHTRNSLKNAIYQGWDLHPAQIPVRYAACYSFFLEVLDTSTDRLKNFVDQAAKATLAGNVFDDAATAQGLLNYFLQALKCGAITSEELQATGLSLEEIQCRSFYKIMENRTQK